MATQEAPEFTSFHEDTKCMVTHGAITSERNPETRGKVFIHWVNKKISTSK